MYQEALVGRTKLIPPRPQRRTLHRGRLTRRLLEAADYRLTLVQAGTGYGKTTALSALADQERPLVWYHLEAEDADPLVFLLHLIYGFGETLGGISEAPLALLERWESDNRASPWTAVVDVLNNELAQRITEPVFLVLDDAHHLNQAAESIRILDRFIGRAPANILPILAGRHPLQLPSLVNWRVRGQVLEIGQDELAFTAEEISALFGDRYGFSLTADQVSLLAVRSEGWAIALQLVWQRLQSEKGTLNQALGRLSGSAGDLFAYLSQEILVRQPEDIQDFLRQTAVLREMTAAICNCLRSAGDSEQILRYLIENELFVVNLGDGHVRYHHVFRDFLAHQSPADEIRAAHRRAAACYSHLGDDEQALHHWLAAGDFLAAAQVLVGLGRSMVRSGRLDTLSGWIGALPPDVLEGHPALMAYLGDIGRLHSHFEEALGWYRQAEEGSRAAGDIRGVGQALRGQARVYLDTVDASQAESLLQEALRLSDGQEDRESRARLLELLAENLINRGRSDKAEQYQQQARALREQGPAEAEISVRLLLRTGRLNQAREVLEERVKAERREPVLRPRAHRETLLLLSLVLAFQGEQEEAYHAAVEGTERGKLLDSSFITAVGHMRQGHAWLVRKDTQGYRKAIQRYQETIELSERLDVSRLQIEAFWGLCQAYGFQGDLLEARRVAEKGIGMAQVVGDEWIEACIRLSLGAGYALVDRFSDAVAWLNQAGDAFRECADTHGQALARMWLCLVWHQSGDETRLERDAVDLLGLVREGKYDFLFRHKTLLGPPEPRSLAPILLFARRQGQSSYAETLLSRLGLTQLESHPGYRLEVQTLGPFRVWRGSQEIGADEWRRKKARQLFQLLLTTRTGKLERDQIVEMLWPELGPDEAQRDFKIAMSALYSVLEPGRGRNAPSAYVERDGALYGLRTEADLGLDAQQFEELIAAGDESLAEDPEEALQKYHRALKLYQGEYLQEYPYEEWSSEERERLLTLYLRTAERAAQVHLDREAWQEAIEACQLILARDDCWENAYRMMMVAYDQLGNQVQVRRVYQRCVDRLRAELDVEPTTATAELYETLLAQG
ncbi:MAG: transcriptional regulator [Chloroflexota bacterium]|nr:MAG: transcriptional regulator [Chloroflexota bacterium]